MSLFKKRYSAIVIQILKVGLSVFSNFYLVFSKNSLEETNIIVDTSRNFYFAGNVHRVVSKNQTRVDTCTVFYSAGNVNTKIFSMCNLGRRKAAGWI